MTIRKWLPRTHKLRRAVMVGLENLVYPLCKKRIRRRRWRRELDRRFYRLKLYVENWENDMYLLYGSGEEECLGVIYAGKVSSIAPAIVGGAPTAIPEIEQDVTKTEGFKRLKQELWDHLAKLE